MSLFFSWDFNYGLIILTINNIRTGEMFINSRILTGSQLLYVIDPIFRLLYNVNLRNNPDINKDFWYSSRILVKEL